MKNYKQLFKDKKITVMGLGLLGRGIGYTKFLAQCGADLIVTDLKTSVQLATSLKALSKFPNIKFVLGEHRLEDFRGRDMIIKAAGVPMDSVYIAEARKNNIPIEMDVSLFAKCAPGVQVVGITGTRGKSMTTNLIYEILKFQEKSLKKSVFIGGNVRGVATLPLLSKVKDGDILVAELDSWQLQGFGDSKLSPNISVFTSFMTDHMNYYKDNMDLYFSDKANIFKLKSKLIVVKPNTVADWKFAVPGVHQMENMACAVEVVKLFGIPEAKIKKAVKDFKGLEGRLELVKNIRGVKIYNDNNATTPEATISGLQALSQGLSLGKAKISGSPTSRYLPNIILICGGNDKNIPVTDFVKAINKYCKLVVTIPGTGTEKLVSSSKVLVESVNTKNLKDAFKLATASAKKGDIILFSPAFSSFSQYNNEYERNDEFVKLVKKFK
ncbi:MAG: Mur ligase family protein [Candidatus Nomurabacteria bacterium]|nr:Mur ligase family protein [Candidatus Nomurabacteria bacterium]